MILISLEIELLELLKHYKKKKNFPAFQIVGAACNGLEAVHIYKEQNLILLLWT